MIWREWLKSLYRFECGLENDTEIISDLIQTIFKAFVFLFFFFLQNQQGCIKIPESLSDFLRDGNNLKDTGR